MLDCSQRIRLIDLISFYVNSLVIARVAIFGTRVVGSSPRAPAVTVAAVTVAAASAPAPAAPARNASAAPDPVDPARTVYASANLRQLDQYLCHTNDVSDASS